MNDSLVIIERKDPTQSRKTKLLCDNTARWLWRTISHSQPVMRNQQENLCLA
jgi:hypothetical protein